jgi:hypothetical protein
MKARRDHETAVEVVAKAIRPWDPYGLIETGAPLDEFDREIARIAADLSGFKSAEDVAVAISSAFEASFGPGEHFEPKDCTVPASQIFDGLRNASLVPAG